MAGLNEPQEDEPQVTLHETSGFAEVSLEISARSVVVALTCKEAGVTPRKETVIGTGGVMVILAEIVFVVSPTKVAVIVTLVPDGMAAGAV